MAIAPVDDAHPSNPVYQTNAATAIAAGGTVSSAIVDVAGADSGLILVGCDQTHSVSVNLSLDETTWFVVVPHLDSAGASAFAAAAGVNTARRLQVSGARSLLIRVTNTGGAGATLNSWVAVDYPG